MAAKIKIDSGQAFSLVQKLDLPDFLLSESVAKKDAIAPVHSHEQIHVTFILEGVCREIYMGRARELSPLTVTYFHPGESHRLEIFSESFRTLDIELDRKWANRLLENPISPAALLDKRSDSIARLTARLYREFKETDDVSRLAIEGLALEILADLARASRRVKEKRPPLWLRQVMEKIQDEFARPLTLNELARSVRIHPSHLALVFRERYGCTPGEFIRRIRIERAIELMADPEASLVEISLATGFTDQSHFSRVFKHAMGMTPGRFRILSFDTNPVQNTRDPYKTDSAQ